MPPLRNSIYQDAENLTDRSLGRFERIEQAAWKRAEPPLPYGHCSVNRVESTTFFRAAHARRCEISRQAPAPIRSRLRTMLQIDESFLSHDREGVGPRNFSYLLACAAEQITRRISARADEPAWAVPSGPPEIHENSSEAGRERPARAGMPARSSAFGDFGIAATLFSEQLARASCLGAGRAVFRLLSREQFAVVYSR
jgi:hypothetical protein